MEPTGKKLKPTFYNIISHYCPFRYMKIKVLWASLRNVWQRSVSEGGGRTLLHECHVLVTR